MTPSTGTNQWTNPRFKDAHLRKKRAAQELGEALAHFLSIDSDIALEYIADVARDQGPREEWLLTEFEKASANVEQMEHSLEAIDGADENVRPMMMAMRGAIEMALGQARGYRDSIQAELSSPENTKEQA